MWLNGVASPSFDLSVFCHTYGTRSRCCWCQVSEEEMEKEKRIKLIFICSRLRHFRLLSIVRSFRFNIRILDFNCESRQEHTHTYEHTPIYCPVFWINISFCLFMWLLLELDLCPILVNAVKLKPFAHTHSFSHSRTHKKEKINQRRQRRQQKRCVFSMCFFAHLI